MAFPAGGGPRLENAACLLGPARQAQVLPEAEQPTACADSLDTSEWLRGIHFSQLSSLPSLPGAEGPLAQPEIQSVYRPPPVQPASGSLDTSELLRDIHLSQFSPLPSLLGTEGPLAQSDIQSVYRPPSSAQHASGASSSSARREAVLDVAAATQWYHMRNADLHLIDRVYPPLGAQAGQSERTTRDRTRALFRFADHLCTSDPNDNLWNFLARLGGNDAETAGNARQQIEDFVQGKSGLKAPLNKALSTLAGAELAPPADDAQDHGTSNHMHFRWPLPPGDRALLEGLPVDSALRLARFGFALLRDGHGGLVHWLAMCRDGRASQARELMVRDIGTNPNDLLRSALDTVQAAFGIPADARIRVTEGKNTYVGETHDNVVAAAAPPAAPSPFAGQGISQRDAMLREVYSLRATQMDIARTSVDHRFRELRRFSEFLVAHGSRGGLQELLERLEDPSPVARSQARRHIADYCASITPGKLGEKREEHLRLALDLLVTIPPEHRHLQTAAGLRPARQRRLLPDTDQQWIQRLRQAAEATLSPSHAIRMTATLTRFGIALMEQHQTTLSSWISMQDQNDGRATAFRILSSHLRDVEGTDDVVTLPATIGRLQALAGESAANAIHIQRSRAAASEYPPDFPPNDRAIIQEAIASEEADTGASTRWNRHTELVLFSECLRGEGIGGTVLPGGLADLIALEHRGDTEAVDSLCKAAIAGLPDASPAQKAKRSTLRQALRSVLGRSPWQRPHETRASTPSDSDSPLAPHLPSGADIGALLSFFQQHGDPRRAFEEAKDAFGLDRRQLVLWLRSAGVTEAEAIGGQLPSYAELWSRLRPTQSGALAASSHGFSSYAASLENLLANSGDTAQSSRKRIYESPDASGPGESRQETLGVASPWSWGHQRPRTNRPRPAQEHNDHRSSDGWTQGMPPLRAEGLQADNTAPAGAGIGLGDEYGLPDPGTPTDADLAAIGSGMFALAAPRGPGASAEAAMLTEEDLSWLGQLPSP